MGQELGIGRLVGRGRSDRLELGQRLAQSDRCLGHIAAAGRLRALAQRVEIGAEHVLVHRAAGGGPGRGGVRATAARRGQHAAAGNNSQVTHVHVSSSGHEDLGRPASRRPPAAESGPPTPDYPDRGYPVNARAGSSLALALLPWRLWEPLLGGPTTSSKGAVASTWLKTVVADSGVEEVAVKAVMLYSRVPRAGLPTSESGIFRVMTPVLRL